MKGIHALIFASITSLFSQCASDSDLLASDSVVQNDLDYIAHGDGSIDDYEDDSFSLMGIIPYGSTWKVIVEYGGGCKTHHFLAISKNASTDDHGTFHLLHHANNDECDAFVRDTLLLNMNAIFPGTYTGFSTATLVAGKSGTSIPVNLALASLEAPTLCSLPVTKVDSLSCDIGIWGSVVFGIGEGEIAGGALLIPVTNSPNVSVSQVLSRKSYTVGFTPLFGFQDAAVRRRCPELTNLPYIPISIKCID